MGRFVLLCGMAVLAVTGVGAGTLWAGINEWTSLGPDGGGARSLAVDPQNPSTVYANDVRRRFQKHEWRSKLSWCAAANRIRGIINWGCGCS